MTADKPKTPVIDLNGKCAAIDLQTQTFSIRDVTGAIHPFRWQDVLNDVMRKWKVGYYLTVTFNPDTHDVKNVVYWQEGKDVFPKEQRGGGKPYQPRNEKPMLYESVFKSLCEMFDPEKDGKGKSFEENADRVWKKAEEIGDKMADKSGVT